MPVNMFNLLIIEDNFIQAQYLINCIGSQIPDVRLYNIASTGKEALEIIKNKKIDIILLDLKLPDISGNEIIHYIQENSLDKYINSIIITSAYIDLINLLPNNKYIFSYVFKGADTNFLISEIKKLITFKKQFSEKNLLIQKINKELHKLNFNFSYIGTRYLSECIYIASYLDDKYNIILQKDVYPIIAKKYNKTVSNIKSNINKATIHMYYDCDEKVFKNFLGIDVSNYNPKPKEIIMNIIEKIIK